jgi:hypothetical protein
MGEELTVADTTSVKCVQLGNRGSDELNELEHCPIFIPRVVMSASSEPMLKPELELDHDGKSKAAFILPQVGAETCSSRDTGEARCRR